MAFSDLPEQFPLSLLLSYFLAAYAMFVAGLMVARGGFRFEPARCGLFAFGCGYSNLMLIGIPLVLTAWGERAVLPLFSIVALHTLLMFTPLTAILEADRARGGVQLRQFGATLLGIARNQYVIGILAGLAWNLFDWPIPVSADSVMRLFAASATPCALFSVGAALAHQRIAGGCRQHPR